MLIIYPEKCEVFLITEFQTPHCFVFSFSHIFYIFNNPRICVCTRACFHFDFICFFLRINIKKKYIVKIKIQIITRMTCSLRQQTRLKLTKGKRSYTISVYDVFIIQPVAIMSGMRKFVSYINY